MSEIMVGQELISLEKKVYLIGRSERSHLRSTSSFLSRFAATLYFSSDVQKWFLLDGHADVKNSRNQAKIKINGKVVEAEEGIQLCHNDLVQLAPDYEFRFFDLEAEITEINEAPTKGI